MKNLFTFTLFSLALAAFGGDASNTDSTHPASAVDNYLGVWKSPCLVASSDVLQSSDNGKTNVIQTFEFTRLSASKLNTKVTQTLYASHDIHCAQPAIGSVTATGMDTGTESFDTSNVVSSLGQNPFSFKETVTLAAGQKVDSFSLAVSPLSKSHGMQTAGAILVDTDKFSGGTVQTIAYFINAKQFFLNGAEPYPEVVEEDPDLLYSKQ